MYAIIEAGGHQWKVEPGTRLDINRVSVAVGSQHVVERVLAARNGEQLQLGRPYVEGAKVICEVLEHRLGPKVISYHFRRRENWRKTVGHRQPLSRLVVKEILLQGSAASVQVAERPAKASPSKKHTSKTTTKKASTTKE